jgi:signal transduction histidine kinase
VIDYGCGMSAEFMRTGLFKPFVSTKPGGFGIGAFESRELVQAMRGRLEAESRQGLGSRFVVRLPLACKDDIASNFGALDPQTDGDRPMSAPIHRKVA